MTGRSRVALLYVDDCPNWQLAAERLNQALALTGRGGEPVEHVLVITDEQAQALRFTGSPTVHLDGVDPFAPPGAAYGLTCRVYRTPSGTDGAPPLEELVAALRRQP